MRGLAYELQSEWPVFKLRLPAELGVNITLKVTFWPAAMLIGTVRPEMLNPTPVTLAREIVTLAVPGFCSVIVCELEPVATAGKLALMGVAESCDCSCGCGVFGELREPRFPKRSTPNNTGATAAEHCGSKHHPQQTLRCFV
jgi:hypothetical protein